jgi:hypothetical protein
MQTKCARGTRHSRSIARPSAKCSRGRLREIHALVDDLLTQERHLIEMKDDGAILAAIFPRRTVR